MKNLMDFTVTIRGLNGNGGNLLPGTGAGRVAMTYFILHGQPSLRDLEKKEEILIQNLWMEGLHSLFPQSSRKISDKNEMNNKVVFDVKELLDVSICLTKTAIIKNYILSVK